MPEDDAPRFDLQAHSVHSDGELAPGAVVAQAASAGVELLALTDHDSVDGVADALEAARTHGIRLVPAVEVSAIDETAEDLHVLGYCVDHTDAALLAALASFREDRVGRADRMVDALRSGGLDVDDATIDRQRAVGAVGRPHLAAAVLAASTNAGRLAAEGLRDVSDVIDAYLVAGRPGFVGRTKPSVADAIDLIHAAGGVAVWAHPFWDVGDPSVVVATLERFAARGLDGVEAFYVTHDAAQAGVLAAASARLGLLSTGSADFHGPSHRLFSRFRAFSLHDNAPNLGVIDR